MTFISQFAWYDVTACALIKILFWVKHNSEHLPSACTQRPHIRAHKHAQTVWILSWPQKQTQGHERRRRSLSGLALAGLSPVDQEKLAHLVAYCNTHKASHSWLFMPLNLALEIKPLSCAVIVDIVGIIYANFKVKASLWILMVNDRENYSRPGGEDAGGLAWLDIKEKIPLGYSLIILSRRY